MIDGCAHHRQADRDIYARLEPEHFYGTVALVVIHRHDKVEVAPLRAIEESVGGQWPFYVPAFPAARIDGGDDFVFFFSVAE